MVSHARLSGTKLTVVILNLGDLAHLLRILENAKVTDDAGHWNGGETTLVQTGDIGT